ncbi:MAG: chorismate synthase, partial [Hyphomicrobium sp.]
RPGHADFTYDAKYGLRDYRGGGRSSARETASRVAAGAVARKVIPQVKIRGALVQVGHLKIDRANWDWDEIGNNPFFSPDKEAAARWADYLDKIRKAGSSVGAIIEVVAESVPAGWGAPLYGKLDQDLASAMMSINAVKGVEIGDGMAVAELSGEQNADEIRIGNDGAPNFLSNHAGGILGGISTGQPIVCRFAVKPTSSILSPRRTIDRQGHESEIATKGRHDPCVGIRAVPVGEAMMAIVLADHFLRHRGQTGG